MNNGENISEGDLVEEVTKTEKHIDEDDFESNISFNESENIFEVIFEDLDGHPSHNAVEIEYFLEGYDSSVQIEVKVGKDEIESIEEI